MKQERKTKKYLPRLARTDALKPPLRLQPRDIEIMKLVNEYRFLTSRQIQLLVLGSDQVILRRLQKLFHNNYLDRLQTSIYEKAIYALGNNGADIVAEHTGVDRGKIDWAKKNREVRNPYINHTLMVSNFKIAVQLALDESPGAALFKWVPECDDLKERVIVSDNNRKLKLFFFPDSWFVIEHQGKYLSFFLEADQSTMTNERFFNKMKAYWAFYRQGKHKEKFGINSFRVLTITKSDSRAENLRQTTKKADDNEAGSPMFWFTSEKHYNPEDPGSILGKIWKTPKNDDLHSLLE